MKEKKFYIYFEDSEFKTQATIPKNRSIEYIYWKHYDKLYRVISPTRVKLLSALHKHGGLTASELMRILGRDYKNIHVDLKRLSKHGLVILEKDGNKLIAKVPYPKILFVFCIDSVDCP